MLPSPSDKKAVINFFVIKSVLGEWAFSMVGVEEGREFRFRGDLYSQESRIPLVIISIPPLPHSFIPGLKASFPANPSHRSLPFVLQNLLHEFPRVFTDTSENISVFDFLVFLFSTF